MVSFLEQLLRPFFLEPPNPLQTHSATPGNFTMKCFMRQRAKALRPRLLSKITQAPTLQRTRNQGAVSTRVEVGGSGRGHTAAEKEARGHSGGRGDISRERACMRSRQLDSQVAPPVLQPRGTRQARTTNLGKAAPQSQSPHKPKNFRGNHRKERPKRPHQQPWCMLSFAAQREQEEGPWSSQRGHRSQRQAGEKAGLGATA